MILRGEQKKALWSRGIMSAAKLTMGVALLAIGGLQMQAQGPPPQGPPPQPPQMQQPEDEVGMSTAGVPAGGNWLEYQAEDKMSPHPRIRFELDGDNFLRGSSQRPKVIIYCTAGKFKLGDFRPNLRIGPPNRVSTWAWRPQLQVRVRVDNRTDSRNWNWVNGRFLAMDKDTTRLLLAAKIFRIEFNSEDGVQVAEFSPTGLDLKRVQQQCGLKPLKP